MIGMKPVLDAVIDANAIFFVAFLLWSIVNLALSRSSLRADYALQLRLLRSVLLVVALSPLLSYVAISASQFLWPETPVTVGDLAVAAYLRGDISMSAVHFEELLNLRSRFLELILSGDNMWLTTVLVAILSGSLFLALQTANQVVRVRGILQRSFVWRRSGSTYIHLSDTISVPFATRGLRRRHVVVPSHLLMHPRELKIVLAHEFEHLRQGDVEWEIVFELLRPLLYWNPVFLLWRRAFGQLRELNCDRAVLRALKVSPREYARCLISFCAAGQERAMPERMNVALLRLGSKGARKALETRVLALQTSLPERHSPVLLWATTVVMIIGIVLAAASVRNSGDWSQDRLMLSTVVNLERLEAINRGN